MQQVVVSQFGTPEVLELRHCQTPQPRGDQVLVRVTSIGLNHADLMGRAGQYKLSTGDPPYTPGLEAGGVVEAQGEGIRDSWLGRRVTLRPEATRLSRSQDRRVPGTYRSHILCHRDDLVPIDLPHDVLPDECLGTLWLSHFTAWGALVWTPQRLCRRFEGARVAITAASSAVALAAAQVVQHQGGHAIGLTSSPAKRDALAEAYDDLILTHNPDGTQRPFRRDLKALTDGRGADVVFDPVAAGPYLTELILGLAQHGTVIVYGLLGKPGVVDVAPLIRKHAAIVGYVNDEVFGAGTQAIDAGIAHVLEGFAQGVYAQRIVQTFPLAKVQEAHRAMHHGGHVGKLVLIP